MAVPYVYRRVVARMYSANGDQAQAGAGLSAHCPPIQRIIHFRAHDRGHMVPLFAEQSRESPYQSVIGFQPSSPRPGVQPLWGSVAFACRSPQQRLVPWYPYCSFIRFHERDQGAEELASSHGVAARRRQDRSGGVGDLAG